MQARVIKKKIKVPVGMKDQDMAAMFNQMLGAGAVNMTVAWPRYKTLKGLIDKLLGLFQIFNTSDFITKRKDLEFAQKEIDAFVTASRAEWTELFKADFSEHEWNLEILDDEQKKQFGEVYKSAKESNLVRTFTVVCDRAIKFKRHIVAFNDWLNKEAEREKDPEYKKQPHKIPSDLWKFISTMSGAEFYPFPFTKLNYKDLFARTDVSDRDRRFLMTVFCKSYELTFKVYHEATSPDINVEEFVDVIMANIDRLGQIPQLNRCKEALQKIKDSVHMLKDNFNDYYRDFVSTKESTIMMEHFILDVSKKTKASPRVMQQFKQIIAFYRQQAEQHIDNPKVKMLFDKVNASFAALERDTENLVKIREAKAKRREGEDGDDDVDLSDDSDSDEETPEQTAAREKKEKEAEETRKAQEANAGKSIDELVAGITGKPVPAPKKGKGGKK